MLRITEVTLTNDGDEGHVLHRCGPLLNIISRRLHSYNRYRVAGASRHFSWLSFTIFRAHIRSLCAHQNRLECIGQLVKQTAAQGATDGLKIAGCVFMARRHSRLSFRRFPADLSLKVSPNLEVRGNAGSKPLRGMVTPCLDPNAWL